MNADPSTPSVPGAPEEWDLGTVKAWSNYAKDRFDQVWAHIDEFRSWGRHLSGILAVLISLELTTIWKVIEIPESPANTWLKRTALLALAVTVGFQGYLLLRAVRFGYKVRRVLHGPERPSVLAPLIVAEKEISAVQIIGAYYAKAFDDLFLISEDIGEQVTKMSLQLACSLGVLLAGFVLAVVAGYNSRVMANQNLPPTVVPSSPPPAVAAERPVPPPTPAPATAPSPLNTPLVRILATPTAGQSEQFTARPSVPTISTTKDP